MFGGFNIVIDNTWKVGGLIENVKGTFIQRNNLAAKNTPNEIPHVRNSIYDYGIYLDTSLQSSYRSNERESRPKTKFFSLMIYAGYPIQ